MHHDLSRMVDRGCGRAGAVSNTAEPLDWQTNRSAAAPSTYPFDAAAADHRPAASVELRAPTRLLGLSPQHYPAVGITVVVVDGELDLLTAPLLEQCLREQLVAGPAHLIVDLESVRFLGASGLSCLLGARELVGAHGSQLHLAGLITSVVQRAVETTGLLGLFSTYPTLLHAVIDLADRPDATPPDPGTPVPVLIALWCCSVGATWTLELRRFNCDTGLGTLMGWISSGVPVTQPAPDALAPQLLGARGLWLFRDGLPEPAIGSRYRVGYVSADAALIRLAHLLRDDAAQAGVHPVILAAWNTAGFSTATATGWIRAGCLLPP
jgi:anti-sigma B factor antagonist